MTEVSDWTRENMAKWLAALDGKTLHDIKSTVGDPADANNWREYLGRADDLMSWMPAAHPFPTGEKVEAMAAQWRMVYRVMEHEKIWSYVDYATGLLIASHPEKYEVRYLVPAEAVTALVAERDDLKRRDDEWLAKTEAAKTLPQAAGMHRADVIDAAFLALKERLAKHTILAAELDDARREVASMKANWDANVQEMSKRFRAVNIERAAKLADHDAVVWCQKANARADKAERERDKALEMRNEHFARAQSLIKDVEKAKAYTSAMQKDVAAEIGRIRAADKTVEQRMRAEVAESSLAAANARVERLSALVKRAQQNISGVYSKWHADARAALTGGENG